MAIDFESAFEIDKDGIVVTDEDGNVTYYITGGSGSPLGQDAPVPTLYIQKEDASVWAKFGPGVNDWNQIASGGEDFFIGGVSASYIHIPPQCVGGGNADGN